MASPNLVIRQSLSETLVAPLREMILRGELSAGEKVPEELLCSRFGVSRTPIREAIKVLAAEGILQILPHRGAIVAKIAADQVDELFPIMAALERLAGTLACAKATTAEIANVRKIHDEMIEHYRAGNEQEYLACNRHIHEAIIRLARNDTLWSLHQKILTRTYSARFVLRKSADHWREAMAEHGAIIAALEVRDGARLGDLLESHVLGTTTAIARAFIENEQAAASVAAG